MGAEDGAVDDSVLVGRSVEVEVLETRLAAAVAGVGTVVLIEGEAGIGKSALVRDVAASAGRRGVHVFAAGTATDRGPVQPFALLVRTLLSLGPPATAVERELAGLIGKYREDWARWSSPDQTLDRTQIEELFAELLLERAANGPSVVLLEDLHLVDDASLRVLERLAAGGAIPSTMLVATTRTVPRRPELVTAVAAWTRAGAAPLEIPALTPPAAVELGERLLGSRAGPVLRARLSAAGGNPQFIVDLVTAAQESDAVVDDADGAVELAGGVVLRDLNQRLSARVAYVGHEALALLSIAAVLGSSFMDADLAAVAEMPEIEIWRILRHCSAAGLVQARGGRLTFRHDLVRDALYAGLTPAVRRDLHRRASRVLFEAGAPAAVVQEHLARADDPHGETD
ncbi:hypothetical protein GALL_340220 [mine drainage metagenome]|uniref:AAA+ ATPase domain-containing protein n=1 Tax=mine drainage metagenome TaxID=410659 RepID=A0A1J5QL44_9ZZZZ